MFFLDGKFLSGCLCTLKSKKPKKPEKKPEKPKKPKNLKTFSKKPRFFPALRKAKCCSCIQYIKNNIITLLYNTYTGIGLR